jgi:3-phosphoshikimate 1-carboxyvinyltransferase
LSVPGDKSVSHRAAILAALAEGRTVITNYSSSADCSSTLEALRGLGVNVERDGSTIRVEGRRVDDGRRIDEVQPSLQQPSAPLDCGNSGTTMRLLAGVLATQPFTSVLVGDESLSRRPMRRVVEPLELMGARVSTEEGHAPLRVEGRKPLQAIEYTTPVASAQVKSCVLLAGLGARGRTRVRETEPTRDHTERMLRWFGVPVASGFERAGEVEQGHEGAPGHFFAELEGPAQLRARDIIVPGDISSAAFLVAAAALLEGSELHVEGVGLNATRARVIETLRALGADVSETDSGERCNEPVGDVRVRGAGQLKPLSAGANVLRGAEIPALIDELPLLAVVGSQAVGGLEIRDARELRVKESDRISAVVENLRAMGASVEEYEDGLRVEGPTRLRGAHVRSFGDHRIAMAFAVAALIARGETYIEGAEECVAVSFPEFFPLLESVTER